MFAKSAIILSLAASAFAQTFSVNTPASLVQCQPASISWVGGTAPIILDAIPGGQVSAAAIANIAPSLSASPFAWTVNLKAGLNITIKATDARGNLAYSSPLVIQSGTSDACLNASAVTSGLSTVSVSAASTVSGSVSASSGSISGSTALSSSSVASISSSVAASSSMAASSSAAASSAATTSSAAATSASAASSAAAASSTSKAGAMATAIAGLPALAVGALGVVAAMF